MEASEAAPGPGGWAAVHLASTHTLYAVRPCHVRRNNHYSVMFKRNAMLYLLVTDLGYINEADVVWERLDGVDGDTQLCDGRFEPFKPHRASQAGAMRQGVYSY